MLANLDVIERKVKEYEGDILNDDQLKAVDLLQQASLQPDRFLLPIIDGPPGTGKTTTGAVAVAKRLIYLHRRRREGRYIVLCFTHAACFQFKKTLEEELGFHQMDVVHLTPWSRETDYERGIVGCPYNLRGLEIGAQRWLHRRPVLITTLLGVSRAISAFAGLRIHMMVDEFSQVSASDFFACVNQLKALRPYQFSLLGDPLQLPVVTTQTHLRPNICSFLRPSSRGTETRGLTIQYRMHEHICEAVNEMRRIFSAFPIRSADKVKDRTLTKLGYNWDPGATGLRFREILDPENPLVLVDTSDLGFEESRGREIKFIPEAKLATQIAIEASKSFSKGGEALRPQILTPYDAQRGEISSMLPERRGKCTTIYKAQGSEYPMVIISFVRSNPERFVGFLDDGQLAEQVYVGCSRAQGKLVVLLSFDTFFEGGHRMFQALDHTKHAVEVSAP